MNFRVAGPSAFKESTACAVVPVPENESSTMSPSSVTWSTNIRISLDGLGKLKPLSPSIPLTSLVPSEVLNDVITVDRFLNCLFVSSLKSLCLGRPLAFEGHKILPSLILRAIVLGSYRQPFG